MQAMQSVLDEEMDEEDEEGIDTADPAQLFEALRASPQFQQLRMLARTNPNALEQVLSSLPPGILQVISNNQEAFLRLLSEDGPAPAGAGGAGGAIPGGPAQQPAFPYDFFIGNVLIFQATKDSGFISRRPSSYQ